MIDIVVPYVDSSDSVWRAGFEQTFQKELKQSYIDPSRTPKGIGDNRFRSWDTLKYLLRGIEVCCPWIHRVYVVIQGSSQRPQWLRESDRLQIVYHSDIIPASALPTYNSATIEMFVWRIEGLSEKFIYINDDMFPLRPMTEEDFFDGDRPRLVIRSEPNPKTTAYVQMLKNSESLALRASGCGRPYNEHEKLKDGHTWTPMLKSAWESLWGKVGDHIMSSCTPFRNSKNVVQQISTYYLWMTGNYAPVKAHGKMEAFVCASPGQFCDWITNKSFDILCINDTGVEDYENTKNQLLQAFNKVFPQKSEFEF